MPAPSPNQAKDLSRIANGALTALFFLAGRCPWLLKLLRPLAIPATVWWSKTIAPNLRCNARRIFGRELSDAEHRAFARGVVGSFYDFVADLGQSTRQSAAQILARVESVDGEQAYLQARQSKRGAILVTAHMGAFEVGLAALRQVEPKVRVVFKRDPFSGFERIRRRIRTMLDVREAPIDDGLPGLILLRDALRANEVVVMQADRAMPGQRSQSVPFFSGRLRLPIGPVKLAQLTGSPIVPVFVIRSPRGKFRIDLGPPISVDPAAELIDGVDPALLAIGRRLEWFVGRYPHQWLILDRAFVEDIPGAQ